MWMKATPLGKANYRSDRLRSAQQLLAMLNQNLALAWILSLTTLADYILPILQIYNNT